MSPPRALWDDDLAQFARLLAEINAIDLNIAQHQALCENMDLEPNELDELFERAHERFEANKRALPAPGADEAYVILDGSLNVGYRAYGPYRDFESASAAHPDLSWILSTTRITPDGTAIALKGNISDGHALAGIYQDLAAAAAATDGEDSWLFTLYPPRENPRT